MEKCFEESPHAHAKQAIFSFSIFNPSYAYRSWWCGAYYQHVIYCSAFFFSTSTYTLTHNFYNKLYDLTNLKKIYYLSN